MKQISLIVMAVIVIFAGQIRVFADSDQPVELKSEAAVLLDSETGAVLFAKNAEEKMYPASLTKIATAIYAIEKGKLDSMVTVSANAVNQDGTRVYLVEGEQAPLKKLIQGMLINSGNDAAVAIAEHLDGNVESFADHLNQYLKSTVGVKNTHFTNPNGLFDENHYTTAMDMALITNYAMKNPIFREIFGTKQLLWEGQSWHSTLITHHIMLKGEMPYSGVTGGKTGYTTESKQTLATTADNGNIKLTAIVLKSDGKMDKYKDTASLLDYGFKQFHHSTIKREEKYFIDNKEFYPEKDILITEDMNGSIKKVNSNGVLSIEKSNGQVLQLIQLKEQEHKPKIALQKNKKSQVKEHLFNLNIIIGCLLVASVAMIIGYKKNYKKLFNR